MAISLLPPRKSGAAITSADLLINLGKQVALTVITEAITSELDNDYFRELDLKFDTVRLKQVIPRVTNLLDGSATPFNNEHFESDIKSLYQLKRPDVILVMHEIFLVYCDVISWHHTPIVCLCHGVLTSVLLQRHSDILKERLEKGLKSCSSVLTVSEDLAQIVFSRCNINVKPISIGMNSEIINYVRSQVSINSNSSINERNKIVLHVSNLQPNKNIILFLEVASLMKDNVSMAFWIIGDGVQEQTARQFVKQRNLNNVLFFGWKKLNEVYSLMIQATTLLVTSNREGLSRVIREAQLFGCVPIAPRDEVFIESIIDGENGLLYENRSAKSIAALLKNDKKIFQIKNNLNTKSELLDKRYDIQIGLNSLVEAINESLTRGKIK